MPLRIAAAIQPQHATKYGDMRDAWLRAEEIGADVVYAWDHFYPLSGDPEGTHFECWTTLAAIAEATERVQVGALVSCNTYRNPDLLADMARTLDHISDGRAILGIGSGWFERDYTEYGYPFGTVQSRLHEFEDALTRIDARLAKLKPGPVNGSLPILIGGSGEKVMLRLVAEHAKIWHAFGDVETIAHKGRVLDEWCAKIGRDRADLIRSTTLRDPITPELVRDFVENAGIDEIVVSSSGPDYDSDPLRKLAAVRDALHG
ncbi:MAG TPA: LLM class F420-dependent oxidoreductase [Gaiellales bacterium]